MDGGLIGYSSSGRKESGRLWQLHFHFHLLIHVLTIIYVMNHTLKQMLSKDDFFLPNYFSLFSAPYSDFRYWAQDVSGVGAGRVFGKGLSTGPLSQSSQMAFM